MAGIKRFAVICRTSFCGRKGGGETGRWNGAEDLEQYSVTRLGGDGGERVGRTRGVAGSGNFYISVSAKIAEPILRGNECVSYHCVSFCST